MVCAWLLRVKEMPRGEMQEAQFFTAESRRRKVTQGKCLCFWYYPCVTLRPCAAAVNALLRLIPLCDPKPGTRKPKPNACTLNYK